MGSFFVEFIDEVIKPGLLLQAIHLHGPYLTNAQRSPVPGEVGYATNKTRSAQIGSEKLLLIPYF